MSNVIFAIGCAFMALVLLLTAKPYFNGPVAQISYSTKECVKVVVGSYTCETLPAKYLFEWVE